MRRLLVLLATAVLALGGLAPGAPAGADSPAGRLVSEVAAAGTPHVLDGSVYAIAQVGDTIVLGGSFTQARNDSGDTSTLTRNGLLAFSASTGKISTTFAPSTPGTVRTVIPAGDGSTVYVGGGFTSVGGVARQRVARVRVADGGVVTAFNAGAVTGQVRDLALRDGRLWMAGAFTHVGGRAQAALTTVNPTTGAPSTYMSLPVAGIHNGGVTQVLKIDISPDGDQLAAVGNFDTLAGVKNHQFLTLDLSGAAAAPGGLQTRFFEAPCARAFDSYMRDLDFAPDGSYLVVSTTGAYGGSSGPCDTASRFEADAVGADVRPSWVDYSGGDTSYAIEATPSAVYIGGHQRWWNNPFAGDRAGPGAVPREGIAALDPANGLPLSWNPGRAKGVGVFDFLIGDQGLWVASDTDRIGNFQYKGRIARMPLNGVTFPAVVTPGLPNDLYVGGPAGLTRRSLSAAPETAGPASTRPAGGLDWNAVRGAFMINGALYVAHPDGTFTRRSFDGTSYGAPTAVNTSDQVVALTDWRNDIQAATGMFFQDGRIYFTRTGSNQLFYRYFSPQSGVVGAQRLVASNGVAGVAFNTVRGMFVSSNGHLYWTTAAGELRRATWTRGGASGTPVASTAQVVSGPGVDGITWNARSTFLFQGPDGGGTGTPPTAAFDEACAGLSCSFDSSASTAPGSSITSWAWQFGDGQTGSGSSPNHAYATPGTYPVTLTVTSATGATATTTHDVTVAAAAAVQHVGSAAASANATSHSVTVPGNVQAGDTLLLFLTLNSTDVPAPAGPPGWTVLDTPTGTQVQGRSWTRTATAADAGSTVTVPTSATVKGDLAVQAYRLAGGSAVVAHAASVDQASGTAHTAPGVLLPSAALVVSRWVAKSSDVVSWTLPGDLVARTTTAGSGGGRLTSVGADNATLQTGAVAGRTATSAPAVTRTVMFTTAVGPD